MNDQDLLRLLRSIKSLWHKYDEDTKYHHAAYHTLLRIFMLFLQGDYSNSEYKQRFKEQIEVLEAYNGEVLFVNSLGDTAREIAMLGLDTDTKRGRGESAGIGKEEILGDRIPAQLRQLSVR